jgi:beta-lactamase class A
MVKVSNKRNQKSSARREKTSPNQSVIELNNYRSKSSVSTRNTRYNNTNKAKSRRSSSSNPRTNRNQQKSNLGVFCLYLFRLLVAGVGIAAIAGTSLHYLAQRQVLADATVKINDEKIKENPLKNEFKNPLVFHQEITPLKAEIEQILAQNTQLQAGLLFFDLDNGNYVELNGSQTIAAASTIKIPLLLAFFQDVDAGKITLNEKLTMTEAVKVGEAGTMQYQPVGTQFTALETATKMIVISDNTATNMILERLGGKDAVNQRFQEWGLENTVINNILPDLEATNLTTPKDLARVLALINDGEIISLKNRDRILGIMQKTQTRTLLPQGLEENAIISHKTGTLAGILGDAGIIDTTNGKRYIGVALVQRPNEDPAARRLIQNISKTVYTYFNQTPIIPSNSESSNDSDFITPGND